MRIYYLHHSAICVVLDKTLLIFDYFMHEPDKGMEQGHISEDDLKNAERVYFFVSHSHHDHYNPCIFEWEDLNKNVTYILDSTLPEEDTPGKKIVLSRGEQYDDGYLSVQDFGSTDIGGSFYVYCEGTSFFHAGDLNYWHWKDEGNARYSGIMEKYFDRELRFLKHKVSHIDYAFFPVDKRMGSDYDEGAEIFIDTMKPKFFIPIHFLEFDDTTAFRKKNKVMNTKVFAIQNNGERLV